MRQDTLIPTTVDEVELDVYSESGMSPQPTPPPPAESSVRQKPNNGGTRTQARSCSLIYSTVALVGPISIMDVWRGMT